MGNNVFFLLLHENSESQTSDSKTVILNIYDEKKQKTQNGSIGSYFEAAEVLFQAFLKKWKVLLWYKGIGNMFPSQNIY